MRYAANARSRKSSAICETMLDTIREVAEQRTPAGRQERNNPVVGRNVAARSDWPDPAIGEQAFLTRSRNAFLLSSGAGCKNLLGREDTVPVVVDAIKARRRRSVELGAR